LWFFFVFFFFFLSRVLIIIQPLFPKKVPGHGVRSNKILSFFFFTFRRF